jgi:DNA-binding NarL/FixJ family response regulator
MEKIKILIIDDHQIIIDGIQVLIEDTNHLHVVGSCNTGEDGLNFLESNEVDLVLLDINLPDINGFNICKKIKSSKMECKVMALTMFGETGYISKMIKSGVDGYLLKNTGKQELLLAIENVMKGNKYFSAEVQKNLFTQTPKSVNNSLIQKLSRREKEILSLIVEELTTDEIATNLFISPTTVISHRKSLLRKLNAKNTAGLVKAAFEYQLLD